MFGKISKKMLILIYILSYKLVRYFCYRQNKNHGVSPPLLPITLTTPPTHTAISIHFCEKMRCRVSIDYNWPFGNLRLPKKKMLGKNHRGVATTPLRRRLVDRCIYFVVKTVLDSVWIQFGFIQYGYYKIAR